MSRRPEPTASDEPEEPNETIPAVRMLKTILEESEPEEPPPAPRNLIATDQFQAERTGSGAVLGAAEATPDGAVGASSPASTPRSNRQSLRK